MALNKLAFDVVVLILGFISIFFHGLGISLLTKLYQHSIIPTQQLLIIHLSCAELITTLIRNCNVIIQLLSEPYIPFFVPSSPGRMGPPLSSGNLTSNFAARPPPPPPTAAQSTAYYFGIFSMTGCFFVVFLIMMVLTLDRLLVVLLKSQYDRFCSVFNAKMLLGFIWCIGIATLVGFSVSYKVHNYRHLNHIEYHVYLVTDVVFIVFAIVSYVVIFCMYPGYENVQHGNTTVSNDQIESKTSVLARAREWRITRTLSNPRFYIPFLIVFTYFVFVVLPHWIYIWKKYEEGIGFLGDPWAAMLILLQLGYASDAIVYIFMQAPVRKLLWKWLQYKKVMSSGEQTTEHCTVDTGV